MKKDEKFLKEKLSHQLSENFDERFWDRIEREVPEFKKTSLFNYFLTGAVMASLVSIFILPKLGFQDNLNQSQRYEIVMNQEMMNNYELLDQFDEDMMDLNDKEWDELFAKI